MSNNTFTKEEATFLVEQFEPRMTLKINSVTMWEVFIPARRILSRDEEIGLPSCSCQYQAFVAITKSYFSQYRDAIYEVYNTPTTRRGRKKKS